MHRDSIPFFGHTKICELGKNASSSNFGMAEIFLFRLVCVTTIGVCVFRCADFGWRTFCLKGGLYEKKECFCFALVCV